MAGNPGLIDFYIGFLSSLHGMFRDDRLAILAHAHLGHTPHLHVSKKLGLLHQVEAALEVFDAIKGCWPTTKVILVGHSVGSWIATQAGFPPLPRFQPLLLICYFYRFSKRDIVA